MVTREEIRVSENVPPLKVRFLREKESVDISEVGLDGVRLHGTNVKVIEDENGDLYAVKSRAMVEQIETLLLAAILASGVPFNGQILHFCRVVSDLEADDFARKLGIKKEELYSNERESFSLSNSQVVEMCHWLLPHLKKRIDRLPIEVREANKLLLGHINDIYQESKDSCDRHEETEFPRIVLSGSAFLCKSS